MYKTLSTSGSVLNIQIETFKRRYIQFYASKLKTNNFTKYPSIFLTSSLWLSWKMVWDLWHSWAKHELRLVIFWRPSYVISAWSGSISPSNRSTSTNALSNSFSSTSSHRNMDMPEPGDEAGPGERAKPGDTAPPADADIFNADTGSTHRY